MKRILTLAIALGAIVSANAQFAHTYPADRNDSRDVISGSNQPYEKTARYNTYNFSERERDMQLERINRDFELRIRQVQYDRWMRSNEKRYQVQRLEDQRREEIRQVWDRFKNNRNGYHDNDNRRNDHRW